jgi:hypothetical protein
MSPVGAAQLSWHASDQFSIALRNEPEMVSFLYYVGASDRISGKRPSRPVSGGRVPCDVGVAAKATTRPRARCSRVSASRCGTRPVRGLDVCRAPGSKSDTLPSVVVVVVEVLHTLHGRIIRKGAQRTGKVAGARPDDARWRSRRRLEQFSVNEYYREEVFSVVSIERSRPSEEYVVTVPVGCLEYSEPAQGELGRRTETRLGLGRRRLASSPIPVGSMSVGAALGSRRRGRNEGPRTHGGGRHGRRTRIRGSTDPHRHGCTR